MTVNNTQYIASPDMWQLFTDRDTSNFLFAGYALFFVDNERTVGKPVYQITGMNNPPEPPYSFIEYGADTGSGWRVDLNSQGAFDQTIYLFPYDDDNNVELYFIEFYNADGVPQFTLEGWPQSVQAVVSGEQVNINYISNPQFLLHNDVPFVTGNQPGQIPANTGLFNFAPGNWYFERPTNSTATDFIIFSRFGSPLTVPEANPRYSLNFVCTVADPSDNLKDMGVRFLNVNTFASDTDYLTFSFWAVCNSGNSINIALRKKYNFGTGGSTEVATTLTVFTVTNSWNQYFFSFIPGSLVGGGYTIGTQDDDYIEFALQAPPTSASNFLFTDVILTPGQILDPVTPNLTANEMLSASLPGSSPVPFYDGANIGLPIIMAANGYTFDTSQVGKVFPTVSTVAGFAEVLCDGSKYETAAYSPEGIPYARVWGLLFDVPLIMPFFGTGADYATTDLFAVPEENIIIQYNNSRGSTAATADGAVTTGFTFTTIHTGANYNATAYTIGGLTHQLYIWNDLPGTATAADPGTSGFTVTQIRNQTDLRALVLVGTTSVTGLGGKYFLWSSSSTHYYVWFTVDGAGTDPMVAAHTAIPVALLSTMSAEEVGKSVSIAISGEQASAISVTAASAITTGSYFNFTTTGDAFYVWFKKDGVGTDPMVSGRLGIEVDIVTADTNAQVASAIVYAINSKYFAAPDLRGMFIRGWDNGRGIDPESASRFSQNTIINGDVIGSTEFDQVLDHAHAGSLPIGDAGIGSAFTFLTTNVADVASPYTFTTGTYGSSEDRPINMYLNYVMKI